MPSRSQRLSFVTFASGGRAVGPAALWAVLASGCFDPSNLQDDDPSAGASEDESGQMSDGSDANDSHDGAGDDAGDDASDDAGDTASEDAGDAASDDDDGAGSDDAGDESAEAGDDTTGDASGSASDGTAETSGGATDGASASASDDASDDGTVTTGDGTEPAALRVFVTSSAFPTNFGGALGADDVCQSVADDAGLGGTFRAWTSDSSTTPLARFQHGEGPYALLDGTVIAADWDDLVDGQIAVAIGITESGAAVDPPSTLVATATTAGGVLQPFNGSCADWTTTSSNQSFGVGNEENTISWSESGAALCDALVSLYCFEQ